MKTGKIIMFVAFLVNLGFLIYSVAVLNPLFTVLHESNQSQLLLVLILPAVQLLGVIWCLGLFLRIRLEERRGDVIKHGNLAAAILILLAPVLFFASSFIAMTTLSNFISADSASNFGNLPTRGVAPADIQSVIK